MQPCVYLQRFRMPPQRSLLIFEEHEAALQPTEHIASRTPWAVRPPLALRSAGPRGASWEAFCDRRMAEVWCPQVSAFRSERSSERSYGTRLRLANLGLLPTKGRDEAGDFPSNCRPALRRLPLRAAVGAPGAPCIAGF